MQWLSVPKYAPPPKYVAELPVNTQLVTTALSDSHQTPPPGVMPGGAWDQPPVSVTPSSTAARVSAREARSRSPWEVLLGWHEHELTKAACRRAGRPGLGLGCVENSVTEIADTELWVNARTGAY